MSYFNLEKQMSFYGAYHSNKVNQLIHIVCVPAIMTTVLVWLHHSGPLYKIQGWPTFLPDINAGLVVASMYALYYLILETTAGVSV
jgi:uncharacterized membrane protein YGL010W